MVFGTRKYLREVLPQLPSQPNWALLVGLLEVLINSNQAPERRRGIKMQNGLTHPFWVKVQMHRILET